MTTSSSREAGRQTLADRVRGAVWGQLVGDAYCLSAYWIYDLDELGDNAGRAGMLGAWMGAHLGVNAIPSAWRERLTAHASVEASLEKLLAASAAG